MKLLPLFLFSLSSFANDVAPPLKLSCEIQSVRSCVGNIPFHCGTVYRVSCQGSLNAYSYDEAVSVKQKLEQNYSK